MNEAQGLGPFLGPLLTDSFRLHRLRQDLLDFLMVFTVKHGRQVVDWYIVPLDDTHAENIEHLCTRKVQAQSIASITTGGFGDCSLRLLWSGLH